MPLFIYFSKMFLTFYINDIIVCIFGFVQAPAAEVGASFYINFNDVHDFPNGNNSFYQKLGPTSDMDSFGARMFPVPSIRNQVLISSYFEPKEN